MSALSMLLEAYPEAVSGEEIARSLSLSRSGVWKRIKQLQSLGVKVSGRQNQGYRLASWPDLLLPELLEYYRQAQDLGKAVAWLPTVDSTNTRAKELARQGASHGTLVVAEQQTAGRGRRGRDWLSEPGSGIFASVILRPNLPAEQVPLLTLTAGIALVEAVQQFGLQDAWLKWPNDVWVGERKLAGVLSELSGQMDHVDFVVIGMGINTAQRKFPGELAERATSFYRELGQEVNRAELLADVLRRLEGLLPALENQDSKAFLDKWRRYDRLVGRKVTVAAPAESYVGEVLGISQNGALIVRGVDGQERAVLAGDVSLRLK
jgi:BirA family biotin operon repressor/biotin-[acetyl-CoA-carboxylase] ligase